MLPVKPFSFFTSSRFFFKQGLMLLSLLLSTAASAHVKWFAPYDVSVEPKVLASVLTPNLIIFILVSIAAVFVVSVADKKLIGVNQKINTARLSLRSRLSHDFEFRAIRYCLALFFTAVWVLGDVVLTPELKHNTMWISMVQLIIIASLLNPRTAFIGGVGIFVLWAYSAYHYGFFHLSDYMIFLGLAIYLFIYSLYPNTQDKIWRYLIMYAAISFTLQWASIEKFVYPEWTYPILEQYPHMTMGLSKEHFMDLAGIVEFILAFLLISVSGIAFFAVTLGLAAVFVLAIIDFGKVDAIGHFGIIASLLVMTIYGPSRLNTWFSGLHKNSVINASYVSVIYMLSLLVFFVMYYSVRNLWLLTTS